VLGDAADEQETPGDVADGLARAAKADETPNPEGGSDWTADADFRFARGDGGLPAPASFAHAVAGGARIAYPEAIYDGVDPTGFHGADEAFGLQLLDTRPVDCQEVRAFPFMQVYGMSLESLDETGDGLPLIPTTACGRTSTAGAVALKDLRGSGGAVSVAPGQNATVPFTLRYAGDAGPTFALSAATGIPGASAVPSSSSLTPAAAGFQDASVGVSVPAGTPAGAYAVTLTATVGGQTRSAQGTVNVVLPGTAPSSVVNPTGLTPDDTGSGVAGASAGGGTSGRMLEFRGFDRSGVGPDHRSINLGDVICHKTTEACGWVTIQLSVRWEQLHAGAEVARAAAKQRVRMVVIGEGALSVPAGGRRRVKVTLPKGIVKRLDGGEVLHAVAAVRPARNRVPLTHRIALRHG
jgi:hypothetical protein